MNQLQRIEVKLNKLQKELDRLKQANHYIPQPGEVVEVTDFGVIFYNVIFVKYNKESDEPFVCVGIGDEYLYKSGESHSNVGWRRCRRLNGEIIEFGCDKKEPDYTHLLPDGYEFCKEDDADDETEIMYLKVKLHNLDPNEKPLGSIMQEVMHMRAFYMPIRKKVQYHVAVHEAVTTEPNPYAVDWSNDPDWADSHCFDEDGEGWWYGSIKGTSVWWGKCGKSGFTLPSGLDWKQSKTRRP